MKFLDFSFSVLMVSSTILVSLFLSPLLANEIPKVLIMSAEDSASVSTNITDAELTVQVQMDTEEKVQATINSQSDFLVKYLQNQGAYKLQVYRLQIEPNYNDEKQIDKYIGAVTINFEHFSDYDQVSEILDKAIDQSRSIDSDDWLASFFSYQIVTSEQNP
ncbi:SIMPL domain-containing protein [Synechocystis salina LEGE 06155]|nr:SIMPL domain-containing protein [Synechocystis salina LEGE 06155]